MRHIGSTATGIVRRKQINNQANVVQWWLILCLLIVFAVASATLTS